MWSSLLRQLQSQGDRALQSLQKYPVSKWVPDKNPHTAQRWEPVQSQWRIGALSINSCYQGDQGESPDLLRDSVTTSPSNGVSKWHWLWSYCTYSFSIYLIGLCRHCSCYFVEIYVRVYKRRKRKMWCPVDIRVYEQWSRDWTRVSAFVYEVEFEGWLYVARVIDLSLVASTNTSPPHLPHSRGQVFISLPVKAKYLLGCTQKIIKNTRVCFTLDFCCSLESFSLVWAPLLNSSQ